jgi:hypothetical protein
MACTECEQLLEKIEILNNEVKAAENLKDWYESRLNYLRFTEVHKIAKQMAEQDFHDHWIKWLVLKEKQQKTHKRLTEHYRIDHLLNGTN